MMINMRAKSLAEPLLCEMCLKGGEEPLILRELFMLAGEGEAVERREVPASCALQGKWSSSSWLWSLMDC